MRRFWILLISVTAAAASLLEQRVDEVIRTSKALAPGVIGVEVVQVRSGKVLYSRNAEKLLTPASNTKLFSTALALQKLGRDHRMSTRLYVTDGPDVDGRVTGDLVIYGGGDPSMSEMAIPYDREAKPSDALAHLDALAEQLYTKGVREIQGDVVGDDSAFPWEPLPPGWTADDSIWEYGAAVSALTFNHGMQRLAVRPGPQEGDAARYWLIPAVEYFSIGNRVRTTPAGTERKVEVDRPLGARQIRLTGTIPLRNAGTDQEIAVDDPALFMATAFTEALTRKGIVVRGRAVSRHREQGESPRVPAGRLIVERSSPPLVELLRVVDKVSQNLWAELMLREVARVKSGDGSRKAGLEQLKIFLTEIGAAKEGYVFADGSGLARQTLVAPAVVTRLLRYMHQSPNAADWRSLLPIGALDGTLEKRFSKNAAANAIQAKTGSLSHVNALSGYAESATYGEVAFSIIVNHTLAPASEVRAAIDKIGLALLD